MADVPIVVQVIDVDAKSVWKGAIRLGQTQNLSVAPGEYTVQATLPSGKVMLRRASVSPGGKAPPVSLDVAEYSPRETLAWAQLNRPEMLETSEDAASSLHSVWLRLWRNNGSGQWNLNPWPVHQPTRYHGIVQYELGLLGLPGQYYVQVGGADVPWRLVAVPADNVRVAVKGRWATDTNDRTQRSIDVEVVTKDANAEVLLAYLRGGKLDSAQEVSSSWQAQNLLEQKKQNPTLAAAAGYFLLGQQALEDVHRIWVHNLASWIEWLPDGAVIDAGYLMRRDPPDLSAARARLIEATARGLPVYTRGLRLLRDWLAAFDDDPSYRTVAVTGALKSVRHYCAAAEWSSTTTAFVGTDPIMPGKVKVGKPESPQHVVFAAPDDDDLAWLKAPDSSWIRTRYGWTTPPDAAVSIGAAAANAASLAVPGIAIASAPPATAESLESRVAVSTSLASPEETERVRRIATGEEAAAEPPPATIAVSEAPAAAPSSAAVKQLEAQLRETKTRADTPLRDTRERVQARLLRVADEQSQSEQLAGISPVPIDVGSGAPAHLFGVAIERVLGTSDLVSTFFLESGLASARAVCRIGVLRNGQTTYATGFLVSPRLVMTAAHVIPSAAEAPTAFVEFDVQDGPDGSLIPITRVACDANRFFFADAGLDVAIVALHEEAGRRFGWLRLIANEGKALIGEHLSSVGHPGGRPKQIALRELPILDIGDPFFWCSSNSMQVSSGTPLFNDQWELIGMWHASISSDSATLRAGSRTSRSRSRARPAETRPYLVIEAVRTSRIVNAINRTAFTGEGPALIEEMLYARPAVERISPLVMAPPRQEAPPTLPPTALDIPRPSIKASSAADTSESTEDRQAPASERDIMANGSSLKLTPEKIRSWLRNLDRFDPEFARSVTARTGGLEPQGVIAAEAAGAPAVDVQVMVETMVRPGRPVLPIKSDRIAREPAFIEPPDGELMVQRLLGAAPMLNPVIPLVGRIDVVNFPRNASFIGTAWLVAPDIVVTNSHVAELIGRRDGRDYTFLPGRFGDPIVASVNWKREMDSDASDASPVERVLFIESRQTADIAFLKIRRASDGARQDRVMLADNDAAAGTSVAVIGYPARAGEDVIPDQVWMERVFGGRYDVKRAAPGLVMPNSRGWATHDCTTLGGNSGSAVIDLATGKAVALHFAGAYVLENYAVPASTIRRYLGRRHWEVETSGSNRGVGNGANSPGVAQTASSSPPAPAASVSVTLPVTIMVSIGSPTTNSSSAIDAVSIAGQALGETTSIDEAVRRFADVYRGDGILRVRPGLVIRAGRFIDTPCIQVVTHPEKIASVRARVPATYLGHAVDVRPGALAEMLDIQDVVSEAAVTSIAYNDGDRTGAEFSFDPVDESMEVLCHVGPERSWAVLSDFIAKAEGRMVSSMYEFHASHIAEAIESRFDDGVKMALVMDNATRVTKAGLKEGEFDRKTVFRRWANDFDFDRIYAPEGPSGLVANSYHIKVTVDDSDQFWLSSGNWKNSSQPNIAPEDLNNAARIGAKKGNREWHVVIRNKTLAARYRNHILADLKFSKENGGREESFAEDVFIDVPVAVMEAVELEAPINRIFEAKPINRRVKVKPLLTPDKVGNVYTEAVLDLIESAEEQLLFQIPYIDSYKDSAKGNLEKLVMALIRKSKEISDVRVILRSDHNTWVPCAEDLKKRGLDLDKCFKHLSGTHTKGMIADGKRILLGSHNWSGGGVTLNRDASLLFDDAEIAEYYRDVFDVDWARAKPPIIPESAITESPRIADPESPVPHGFRRIALEEFFEG
ncbi:trypsin-like peptidase domain-containing protein [Mesorhizobium sp. WSM2561]|uniref:trypsin-like peptidase domain-containing protein n=1 Tax=Mesorhizobium sp. WSM2561 TaxID=1040985 RepID=UPI00048580B8|nr:trypsin-like peptidase domain-containing protein [Mesorhizobium sp. WSM2561]